MSTIDYDPLDEEEAFTNTSLNAGFTEVAGGINAIDVDAVKRYSLRGEHQPSLARGVEHTDVTWTTEMDNGGSIGIGANLFATANIPVPGPSGDLEVLFPSGIILGMSEASGATDRIGALLVLANVRVGKMDVDTGTEATVETHNNIVVLTIQAKDSVGWHDVSRTRRSLSMPDRAHLTYYPKDATGGYSENDAASDFEHYVDYDIPLRTLLNEVDLPTGSTIYGVRVVIRGAEAPTGMPTSGGWLAKLQAGGGEAYYSVAQSNLSAIPFHALAVLS